VGEEAADQILRPARCGCLVAAVYFGFWCVRRKGIWILLGQQDSFFWNFTIKIYFKTTSIILRWYVLIKV